MATDPRAETLARLASIDVTLKAILLVLSEKRTDAPSVPDRLLEGQHGDPLVRMKDPRDWTGEPMKGRTFSQCPPEYLDLCAERFDYFIQKANEGLGSVTNDDEEAELRKEIKYKTLDAQRARGWAARLRKGWTPPAPAAMPEDEFARNAEPVW